MNQYYKSSSKKSIDGFQLLYSSTIIIAVIALSFFYIFGFPIVDAQNSTDITQTKKLLNTADTLYNQQKFDEAIKYYDKVLAINSSQIDALNNKGITLMDLKRYDDAIKYFDQILVINASDVTAINNKAQALAEIGRNAEALAVIEKVVDDNPKDEYVQSTMAFILANLGKVDDAKKYYEQALKINPNLAQTLFDKELDAFNKIMTSNQTQ